MQARAEPQLQPFTAATSSADLPFVSVIIPVYNDAERLALCLQALEEQSYPSDRYEVIAVDNGSVESIEPVVRGFPHAIASFEAAPGSYVARNRGLGLARGSVLAFTDSDCIPQRDWLLEGVLKLRETPGCGLVGGRIDISFADEREPTAVEFFDSLWGFPQEVYVLKDRCTVTANLIAYREAFERAGPFDRRLKSGGDREWCGRAVASGYEIAYADRSAVSHPARRTLDELSRKTRRVSGGRFDRLKHRSRHPIRDQAKEMLWELRPPFRAIGRIWSDARIRGTKARLSVLGVVMYVRYLTAWERLRLLCGAESRR
ncbi:MAG TPA: glycosyltransferase [Dehalococcoidia bacterium]|jgi:glycosyltransferase involved in cell wall biosynthesis|nr:glycosyltransferase [Dehalococcoidia bacterium]